LLENINPIFQVAPAVHDDLIPSFCFRFNAFAISEPTDTDLPTRVDSNTGLFLFGLSKGYNTAKTGAHILQKINGFRSEDRNEMVCPELVIVDDKIVAVRLSGQEFPYESESGESVIPKKALTGFRLSEIPEELTIRPVESIEDNQIEVKDDIRLSFFADGSASASVEVMERRKHWDGDVGLTPYMEAFRQAIRERNDAEESDFQDDGDYIFLYYDITISEDLEIQEAINQVEGIITAIEKRADQLAHRRSDALTGLLDRGSFDADLAHAREYPKDGPLSLLVIDLDKFKTINDTCGHPAGDEVLKKSAGVVLLACKSEGSCYRYGGDEMIVLLPKHSLQQAAVVAERIRVSIAELKFEKSSENITASIGLTSYPEATKAVDDILLDADAMVYQAKDDGGNAVRGAMASEKTENIARTIRLDIASRVEAVELWMQLRQGSGDHFSAYITNDSDEDVTVEAITLRKGKVYLSEPTKASEADDWKIPKRSSKTINWRTKSVPSYRLQLVEPVRAPGVLNEIDIVVWGRVLGRRKTFTHTILATHSNNVITEF
jgi:diguanylate cyclase (GGDEF)-like protein